MVEVIREIPTQPPSYKPSSIRAVISYRNEEGDFVDELLTIKFDDNISFADSLKTLVGKLGTWMYNAQFALPEDKEFPDEAHKAIGEYLPDVTFNLIVDK